MARPVGPLVSFVLLASAAALLLIALAGEDAEAQIPEITVSLDGTSRDQVAFPTSTENDILVFDGCLTLSRPFWPPGTSVVIELTIDISDVDQLWPYSIDPPTHTFTASETQAFTAQVTVPAGLDATTTLGPTLEFTASTDDILIYDAESDTTRVTIAQYYRMTRYFSTQPIKVVQGEVVEFNFTVVNEGNGVDTFSFEVTNQAEMLFAGLTLPEVSPKRLARDEGVSVVLTMQADAKALEGQFKLNLTITSDGSAQDSNYERPVTSSIEWNVVVEPSLQQTIWDNLIYIVPGVVIFIVVVAVIVILRRRRAEREGEEPEEEAPPPEKKRKKRPSGEGGGTARKTPPAKRRRPPPRREEDEDGDEDDGDEEDW